MTRFLYGKIIKFLKKRFLVMELKEEFKLNEEFDEKITVIVKRNLVYITDDILFYANIGEMNRFYKFIMDNVYLNNHITGFDDDVKIRTETTFKDDEKQLNNYICFDLIKFVMKIEDDFHRNVILDERILKKLIKMLEMIGCEKNVYSGGRKG